MPRPKKAVTTETAVTENTPVSVKQPEKNWRQGTVIRKNIPEDMLSFIDSQAAVYGAAVSVIVWDITDPTSFYADYHTPDGQFAEQRKFTFRT